MNFKNLIEQIDPQLHQRLKTAIEIGKWPDGKALTREQKELCLEAVIAYETNNLPEDQRTGYLDQRCASEAARPDVSTQPLIIKH